MEASIMDGSNLKVIAANLLYRLFMNLIFSCLFSGIAGNNLLLFAIFDSLHLNITG